LGKDLGNKFSFIHPFFRLYESIETNAAELYTPKIYKASTKDLTTEDTQSAI